MREKLKIIISCALILVCLPYLITCFFQKEETSAMTDSEENCQIASILAAQVPVTVEDEALKAQAVIVRTQIAWSKKHEQELPQALSKKEMEELWGQEEYYNFYERMLQAAQDTDGQVMTFEGEEINPSFHKVSAGMTRDGSQVYKDTPYLLSVKSSSDILSDDYLNVQFYTREEFEKRFRTALSIEEGGEEMDLQKYIDAIEIETDTAGYVTEIGRSGQKKSADVFVEEFGLPSACFSLKAVDDQIRIVTKGCGHGYGLSQYGANDMAKNKKKYDEILKYYFSGIKIEKTGQQ